MRIYRISELGREDIRRICRRNPIHDRGLIQSCEEIFEAVSQRGDDAVRIFTERFDGVRLEDFQVASGKFTEALETVSSKVLEAYQVAIRNIRAFHSSQQVLEKPTEVQKGVSCWRAARAIQSVGLYVPAGTAILPSTVLMLSVPAKLAGCAKIILCVPPGKDGNVAPEILAAAQLAGVRQVFKIGGAQAIAAMALGTETVPRVDKILGPGNRYVQTAKLLATFRGVAIDMVAGPSEVLVISDGSGSAAVTASDLISQAEHGSDSQSVLVSTSAAFVDEVLKEIEMQLQTLPRRELARDSLDQSFAMIVDTLDQAFDFSNRYAPEHLILSFDNAREWIGNVQSAGSVFVGRWSPEVAGDYASGTNHTLPTSGAARSVSGVSMDSFVKKITFQELTRDGLADLAPTLETLAGVESLQGHARAVQARLKEMKEGSDE